jgi:glutamyl-tRNA reductase
MVNRKQIKLERFLEDINKTWQLSTVEQDVLDSLFNLLLAGKNTEIKKIEYLLNDEIEDLLKLLNDREVIDYVTENWDFIASDDEDGLEEALDKLNFNWVEKISDTDMIDSLQNDGWSVTMNTVYPRYKDDIVTQSNLHEMTYLFLNLSPQKRGEIINSLKND